MSTIINPAPRRRQVLLLLAAGVALAMLPTGDLAAQSAAKAAAAPAAVEIHEFHFVPETLTVAAGTTVTWTNSDDSPHTIAETKAAFRSPALDNKDTFSHTFAAPGEYVYHCTLHPQMVGKIIVKPAGSPS